MLSTLTSVILSESERRRSEGESKDPHQFHPSRFVIPSRSCEESASSPAVRVELPRLLWFGSVPCGTGALAGVFFSIPLLLGFQITKFQTTQLPNPLRPLRIGELISTGIQLIWSTPNTSECLNPLLIEGVLLCPQITGSPAHRITRSMLRSLHIRKVLLTCISQHSTLTSVILSESERRRSEGESKDPQ